MKEREQKVFVLISTYNGEKYLREQLDSIYSQTYNRFQIFVRDDGSVDSTIEILEEYSNRYHNLEWYSGRNKGVSQSFFSLMRKVPSEDVIYVFADQDDVWLPNKLEHLVDFFLVKKKDKPLLYCGDNILVNASLNTLKPKNFDRHLTPAFGNALLENICIGCTSAMNQELFSLIVKHVPRYTVMYDWWFYLTASCFGAVFFDEVPLVLYRQHQSNVVGSQTTAISKQFMRFKRYRNQKGQIIRQAKEFSEIYNVDGINKALLQCLENYKNSYVDTWKVIRNKKIFRQRKSDDFIFKLLFLFRQV